MPKQMNVLSFNGVSSDDEGQESLSAPHCTIFCCAKFGKIGVWANPSRDDASVSWLDGSDPKISTR
jgi:hypothetical protein